MLASRIHQLNTPLKVERVEKPVVEQGGVVIEIASCGVNFPDLLMTQGKYQSKPPLPFVPGGEVAGTVVCVGEGVRALKNGDHVVAFTGIGGFQQQIAVLEQQCIAVPKNLPFDVASAFAMTYGTTHYALLHRAKLRPNDTLLVLGASGGVGSAAIEIAKLVGARVVAAAGSAEKLEFCRQLGADEVINYNTEDLKQRAKEANITVVYDAVGGKYSEPALRALQWNGRFLVIGFAAGDIPKIPLNLLLLKNISAIGVFWGAWQQKEPQEFVKSLLTLADWICKGDLKPRITRKYALDEAQQCLDDFANRRVTGKVVVLPQQMKSNI